MPTLFLSLLHYNLNNDDDKIKKKQNETKQISRKKESKQNHQKCTQTLRHISLHIQKPIKTKSETIIYKEKTCKVKKIHKALCKTNKVLQNTIKFILCWSSIAQQWSLPLSVVCIPSEIPLEKTDLSFRNGYQLKIIPGLRMGGLCPFLRPGVWLTPVKV